MQAIEDDVEEQHDERPRLQIYTPDKPVCLHCKDPQFVVNRPRGLCGRCFAIPEVREATPKKDTVYNRRGSAGTQSVVKSPEDVPPPPPITATREERIAVYMERAAAQLPLFELGPQELAETEAHCCMACGTPAPRKTHLAALGWHVRYISRVTQTRDVVCGDCYQEHGWWDDLGMSHQKIEALSTMLGERHLGIHQVKAHA